MNEETMDEPSTPSSQQPINDVCTSYQLELERKANLQCQQIVAKSDIEILAKEVQFLAEESKKSSLIQKWSTSANSEKDKQKQKELPEDQTARLCSELVDDQDLVADVVQGLHQQQSKVDSEVAQVMSELKGYYAVS